MNSTMMTIRKHSYLAMPRLLLAVFGLAVFLMVHLGYASEESPKGEISELFAEMREAVADAEQKAKDVEALTRAEDGAEIAGADTDASDYAATHPNDTSVDAQQAAPGYIDPTGRAVALTDKAPSAYPGDLEKAAYFRQEGHPGQAVQAYLGTLNKRPLAEDDERRAILGLAEVYYDKGAVAQSVSMLDQYLERFPGDARRARMLFQKGLMYQEMGFYGKAITTFYRVLNSIIVMGDADVENYLRLARRAQFEIARSHYDAGQWEQALSLLERIELFELSALDRETILYYKAKIQMRVGRRDQALLDLDRFLDLFPESELVPEVLYNKAEVQMRLQRHEAALETLMVLLEQGGTPEGNASENWVQWRKLAGNFFSNYYFEQDDYMAALRLYQGIVVLDESLEWRLPIVFQMAVCFEKMALYDRAEESLQFVVQQIEGLRGSTTAAPLESSFEHLYGRAQWRLDMVQWRSQFRPYGTAALPIKVPPVTESMD